MLSRIAESLFWIGRYVERADDTARILDVHTQRLVEDPWIDERRACANLLGADGLARRRRTRPTPSGCWPRWPSTGPAPARSSARCRPPGRTPAAPARCCRREIWESLNVTHNALPQQRTMARRYGPHSLFRFVRERSAMVFGLADATMSRDESWLFLILGRSLERVDMTSRMLSTRVLAGDAAPSWTLVLRSTGAYEPYLRTYRGMVNSSRAAEFLLLDRLFPRSVFAALEQAEACLAELERSTVRDAARIGVAGEAHRIVGRARTMLEFMSTAELLAQLPDPARGAAAHLLGGQRRGHPPLLHRAGAAGLGAGGASGDGPQSQSPGARRSPPRTAAHRWRLQVVHRTAVPLQRPGALLLQRGPADAGEQQPADDAALAGRDRAGRHRATPTATTGAPRSPRSTCTSPHAELVGHRRRRSSRPGPTSPGTTGWAGRRWPPARCATSSASCCARRR